MTRLALSDETEILNRLDEMEKNVHFGTLQFDDVNFSIKTIRCLLLELYLTRSYLDEEDTEDLNVRIQAAQTISESMRMFEANKPI